MKKKKLVHHNIRCCRVGTVARARIHLSNLPDRETYVFFHCKPAQHLQLPNELQHSWSSELRNDSSHIESLLVRQTIWGLPIEIARRAEHCKLDLHETSKIPKRNKRNSIRRTLSAQVSGGRGNGLQLLIGSYGVRVCLPLFNLFVSIIICWVVVRGRADANPKKKTEQ